MPQAKPRRLKPKSAKPKSAKPKSAKPKSAKPENQQARKNKMRFITTSRTRRVTANSVKMLYPQSIDDREYQYYYERDEFANHIANRLRHDVFNKWFEIEAEDKLRDEIIALNERLRVKFNFGLGYIYSKVFGYSLMSLSWIDSSGDITEEPGNISGINKIEPISKPFVDKIHRIEDIKDPAYGTRTAYDIIFNTDTGLNNILTIPASRFLHWTNWGIDNDDEGISLYKPLYDKLLIKKNMDYALGETVWKNASSLYVLKMPEDNTDEEDDWAEENWKNINVKSTFTLPHGYEIDIKGTSTNLNPRPYTEYLFNTIGSGSRIGRTLLLGVQAGAVTGAEHNLKDYHGMISDEQTEIVEPVLREFYELLQEHGILSAGDFKIVWQPTLEMDEQDWAEVYTKYASGMNQFSQALNLLKNSEFKLHAEEGKLYMVLPDPVDNTYMGVWIEGLNVKELENYTPEPDPLEPLPPPPMDEPLPPVFEFVNAYRITDEEHTKLKDAWKFSYDETETGFQGDLTTAVSKHIRAWVKQFKDLWDAEGLNAAGLKVNADGLYDKLIKIKGLPNGIGGALEEWLAAAFMAGADQTADALGIATAFTPDMPEVRAWLELQAPLLRDDITRDLNGRMLRGIREGIQAGESYKKINERLMGMSKQYMDGIPKTVHKVTHSAMHRARVESMKRTGNKTGIWLTMRDGKVRTEHRVYEGQEFDLDKIPPEIDDYGCRCVIMPVPALDELRSVTP